MNVYLTAAWNGVEAKGILGSINSFQNEALVFLARVLMVPVLHLSFLPRYSFLCDQYPQLSPDIDKLRGYTSTEVYDLGKGRDYWYGENPSVGMVEGARWLAVLSSRTHTS